MVKQQQQRPKRVKPTPTARELEEGRGLVAQQAEGGGGPAGRGVEGGATDSIGPRVSGGAVVSGRSHTKRSKKVSVATTTANEDNTNNLKAAPAAAAVGTNRRRKRLWLTMLLSVTLCLLLIVAFMVGKNMASDAALSGDEETQTQWSSASPEARVSSSSSSYKQRRAEEGRRLRQMHHQQRRLEEQGSSSDGRVQIGEEGEEEKGRGSLSFTKDTKLGGDNAAAADDIVVPSMKLSYIFSRHNFNEMLKNIYSLFQTKTIDVGPQQERLSSSTSSASFSGQEGRGGKRLSVGKSGTLPGDGIDKAIAAAVTQREEKSGAGGDGANYNNADGDGGGGDGGKNAEGNIGDSGGGGEATNNENSDSSDDNNGSASVNEDASSSLHHHSSAGHGSWTLDGINPPRNPIVDPQSNITHLKIEAELTMPRLAAFTMPLVEGNHNDHHNEVAAADIITTTTATLSSSPSFWTPKCPPFHYPKGRTADAQSVQDAMFKYNRYTLQYCNTTGMLQMQMSLGTYLGILDNIASFVQLKQNDVLFDWGSGCGTMLNYYHLRFNSTGVGIDVTDAAVRHSIVHRQPRQLFCLLNGIDLRAFPSTTFDAIVTWATVYHVRRTAQQCEIVNNFIRMLKPGGRAFVGHLRTDKTQHYWRKNRCKVVGATIQRIRDWKVFGQRGWRRHDFFSLLLYKPMLNETELLSKLEKES